MAKTLTPAPYQSPLVGNQSISPQSDWWTWFDLLWRYVRGFYSLQTGDLALKVNETYYADSPSQVVYTLPANFGQNDFIQIIGKGAGGWQLAMGLTQQVVGSMGSTTLGGTITSSNQYDCVLIKAIENNTTFVIVTHEGSLVFA